MAALTATGLEKRYEDSLVLGPVHLAVAEGERVALLGVNGSGKTTLLRLFTGVIEPSAGTVSVCGEPAGSLSARAALSFISDTPVFYDDLSLAEHLEYIAGLHGVRAWRDRAEDLVERLGLSGRVDDLPNTFSRGLRQKASLAIGLVRPHRVLLVDEPYVGLDAAGRTAFEQLIDEASAAGVTVVVATHQLESVGQAVRCVVLGEGSIVHDGALEPDELTTLLDP
ncbi:MAG: type transport system ATP-binding protein [Acidimicrobiaceae bacterium]|nr:type transport system ATP-binding protein [Acidimicrobiaceae bacterium]